MDNPFLIDAPETYNQLLQKKAAAIDGDGLITEESNKPLQENPFIDGGMQNPFLDEPKPTYKSVKAPKTPEEPKTMKDVFLEHGAGNVFESFVANPLVRAARVPKKPDLELNHLTYKRSPEKLKEDQARFAKEAKEYKSKRVAEIINYEGIKDWYYEDHSGSALAGAAVGQVLGSLTDPANLLPMGKGATVLKTILKGAGPMGAYGSLNEYASQKADIEMGIRDDLDYKAIAAAGAASAVVGGGVNAGVHHGSLGPPAKPPVIHPKESPEFASRGEYNRAYSEAPEIAINQYEGKAAGDAPPPQGWKQYPGEAPVAPEGQYPRLELDALPPETLTPEGPKALEPNRPVESLFTDDVNMPKDIESYPKPFMDQLQPDVDSTNASMNNPFINNVVDFERAQAYPEVGAHSEMNLVPDTPPEGKLATFEPDNPSAMSNPRPDRPIVQDFIKSFDTARAEYEKSMTPQQLVESDKAAHEGMQELFDVLAAKTKTPPTPVKAGRTKRGRKQSGFIDISKGGNEDYFREHMPRTDVDPNWTAEEVVGKWDGKDLNVSKLTRNGITPNQIDAYSNNIVFSWFMSKMNQIMRQVNPRFYQYKEQLKPYLFGDNTTKITRTQQINTFKVLVDINSPYKKIARQMAENQNLRRQFLESEGLTGREVDFAVTVLDIMRDVRMRDMASAARLGRKFDYEPMYFPRNHGGRFIARVRDVEGRDHIVKGFDNYTEAREFEASLRNEFKARPGYTVEKVQRNERSTFADDFSQILLEQEIPMEFLKKGVTAIEKKRELAPVAFEKQRRREEVGGYTGESLFNRGEEERLLKVLQWRLQASRNFEMKSRMLAEIKHPLMDKIADAEGLRKTIGMIVNKELGVDISRVSLIDDAAQVTAETFANAYHALRHLEKKALGHQPPDFRWEDPKITADFAKDMVRKFTYLTSLVKLGLNPPVLATNFASNAIIGLDGIRTAKLEGLDSTHAYSALWDSLTYIGKSGTDAHKFMQQAKLEGGIEPHAAEHYTTAEIAQRGKADRIVQAPRDAIEQFTNYNALLYYYNFFRRAQPELTGEALTAKVYKYARSFTGQYDAFASPLMFDRLGTAGQSFTNFSKWHYNQLGRLMVDVKDSGRTAVPLLMSVLMAGIVAGAYGLPVVVEYEGIRRLGMALGGIWDLPPISAIGGKLKDHVPYWEFLERGAITAGSEALAKHLGANSGPDLSGSMRYSAFFDAPTVAIQHLWDITTKMIPHALKEAPGGNGASNKLIEEAFNAYPPAAKGYLKHHYSGYGPLAEVMNTPERKTFKEAVKRNGELMYNIKDPSDEGRTMYTLSDMENLYNLFGMKSKRENQTLEAIYWDKWLERQNTKELAEYTQGLLSHLHDPKMWKTNMRKIIELGGTEAMEGVLSRVETRMTASQLDYFTTEFKKLAEETDTIQARQRIEKLRKSTKLLP